VKDLLLFFSIFQKERLCGRLQNCSFQKSDSKSDRSFAPLQRALTRAIAHSLFFKERQKEQSLFCSFEKSDEKSDRSFALLQRAIALLKRVKKRDHSFALSKRVKVL